MGVGKRAGKTLWFLVLGGLLWLVPQGANAQAMLMLLLGDKIVAENFQPGISASFVGTGFWGFPNSMRLSWAVSLYGEIRLRRNLSLQPEFIIKNPGGARKMSPDVPGYPFEPVADEPTLDSVIEDGSVERELRSVAFPVLLKYIVGPIGLAVGPQFNVQTQATDTVKQKQSNGETISLEASVRDALRWYDVGVVGNVEYAFSKGDHLRSFRVRLRSVLGLVDTIKGPGGPIRNWNISFGIDIPIGSPKKSMDEQKGESTHSESPSAKKS